MTAALRISAGQYSDKGRKEANQDFHGLLVPEDALLRAKGIAVALADGISSSAVGHIAAETAVKSFLNDYYCTSPAWTVRTSAQRVIAATNSWLHAQTRSAMGTEDMDKGYVCTLSVLVLASATAHLLHVGDSRIYRLAGQSLEQLTEDHRVIVSSRQSYLGRALGAAREVDIDYHAEPVSPGDVFLLVTDGVYEHVPPRDIARIVHEGTADLDAAARRIAEAALEAGSTDNLTVQLIRVDAVPAPDAAEALTLAEALRLPPALSPRMEFDGYRIQRQLHASARSHIWLAEDMADGALVALKVPSVDLREDAAYLKRFMLEEWVARRVDSAHVLRPRGRPGEQRYLYVVSEYIEGQTLSQWMRDNQHPTLEQVRDIVEQVARGLRAFHRKEILHQDLRPENIMIDRTGTVKIIDFGSTRVAGVAEAAGTPEEAEILGTVQFTAPEYFLGEAGTPRSDLFSLGVIAYQMLTGRLPYGAAVAQARSRAQQRRLRYQPASEDHRHVPAWLDAALEKAVAVDPADRYEELSEFLFDLRHPNTAFGAPRPLLQRNPLLFWQASCAVLGVTVLALLYRLYT
ncbi:bifunctional protein-serine/threonine kinase/phosphatase [Rhodovarius crocodyli]|uniref:Bifunctional protein-serine/threonine kinase/phosphatase n=1 Tax=Rhodovarius crocodyli TaxID=1979269 RepID=A0A437MPA2_9PROT|nr:bifunctional protein-serine/threonine kinase/phosphatase [Rhodovarius crocodyli]RVT99470.1 bifunctional protein-serine/threonine kinase/phosphatase [Rhodovarius crocodyli]